MPKRNTQTNKPESEQPPPAAPEQAPERAAAAEGSTSRGPAEGEPGEAQLQAVTAERDDFQDKWLRSRADFENYRKRVNRELEEQRQFQSLHLVRDLLPALDNLERAVQAAAGTEGSGELVTGLQMVIRQIQDVLTRHSVVPIESVGQPFDPNLHQAIQQVPSADHPPMTVLHELERGYRMHDRVVRPSKVVVSREAEET